MATNVKSKLPAQPAGTDAIDILEDDHERIKQLLSELVEAEDDRRQAVLDELKAILTIHNATEENLVYPAVRFMAKRGVESDKLYHQQDEAKVAVWELDMLAEGDEFGKQAAALQSAVLAHIRKEEETEFPHLREAAGASGLRDLTAAVREFRANFQFAGAPAH
jgi:hemerythrin superfamily protein